MTVSIISDGLSEYVRYFEQLPAAAEQAAVLAVNQVAERDGLAVFRREMTKQVNFPKGYLNGDRLRAGRKASRGAIEASIRGRDRPTSLARFAAGQTPENTRGRGVRVSVKSGQTRKLPRAFLVNLRNGNIGLAVRLKPGETLSRSEKAVKLSDNLYLLYGPSVDQVFKGVAEDTAPEITRMLSNQFLRQFARLSRG